MNEELQRTASPSDGGRSEMPEERVDFTLNLLRSVTINLLVLMMSPFIESKLRQASHHRVKETMRWTDGGLAKLLLSEPIRELLRTEAASTTKSFYMDVPRAADSDYHKGVKREAIVTICLACIELVRRVNEFFSRPDDTVAGDFFILEPAIRVYTANPHATTYGAMISLFGAVDIWQREEMASYASRDAGRGGGGGDDRGSQTDAQPPYRGGPTGGNGGNYTGAVGFMDIGIGGGAIGGDFAAVGSPKSDCTDGAADSDGESGGDDMAGGCGVVAVMKQHIAAIVLPLKKDVDSIAEDKCNEIVRSIGRFCSKHSRVSPELAAELRVKVNDLVEAAEGRIRAAAKGFYVLSAIVEYVSKKLRCDVYAAMSKYMADSTKRTVYAQCSLVPKRAFPVDVTAAQFTQELNHVLFDAGIVGCLLGLVSSTPGADVMTFVMAQEAYDALLRHKSLQMDCDRQVCFYPVNEIQQFPVKICDSFDIGSGKNELKRCERLLESYGIEHDGIHVMKDTSTLARMMDIVAAIGGTGSAELQRSTCSMISRIKVELLFGELQTFIGAPESIGESPAEFIAVFARKVATGRVVLTQYVIVSHVPKRGVAEDDSVGDKVISGLWVAAIGGVLLFTGPPGLLLLGAATTAINAVARSKDKVCTSYLRDIEAVALNHLLRTGVMHRHRHDDMYSSYVDFK